VLETQSSPAAQPLEPTHSTQRSVVGSHTKLCGQSSEVEHVVIGRQSLLTHSSLASQSVTVRQSTHSPVGTLHFARSSGRDAQSSSSLHPSAPPSPLPGPEVPPFPPRTPLPPVSSPAPPPRLSLPLVPPLPLVTGGSSTPPPPLGLSWLVKQPGTLQIAEPTIATAQMPSRRIGSRYHPSNRAFKSARVL
jgi:hypothetical protein